MSEKQDDQLPEIEEISQDDINEVTAMLDSIADDDVELKKTKEEKKPAPAEIVDAKPIENDKLDNYVVDLLESFKDTDEKILKHFTEDRKEIQDVITHLRSRVFSENNPQRVYVEMLVQALKIKSETNANAIKLLDSKAKLLAAGRNQFVQTQDEGAFPLKELERLLDHD